MKKRQGLNLNASTFSIEIKTFSHILRLQYCKEQCPLEGTITQYSSYKSLKIFEFVSHAPSFENTSRYHWCNGLNSHSILSWCCSVFVMLTFFGMPPWTEKNCKCWQKHLIWSPFGSYREWQFLSFQFGIENFGDKLDGPEIWCVCWCLLNAQLLNSNFVTDF